MILVDTSVLVDFLRGKETPAVRRLEEADRTEEGFGIPIVCLQEVLQGARDEVEWKRLHANLTTQEIVAPADLPSTYLGAARIFFDCRRKGLTVRSSVDCLIAQLAIDRGEPLLHDDTDFEVIRKVRPLRTLRY